MSFFTGTNVELLYSNTAVGAAKSNFTSEALINDAASMGTQPVIPAFFFPPNSSGAGKTIKVVASGIASNTATPTFQMNCRLNTAINVVTGPICLGMTGLVATASGTNSNLYWEFEGEFLMVAPKEPTGTNTTILGTGRFSSLLTGGPMGVYAGGSATAPTTTIDIGQPYYLTLSAAWNAASASNSIQLQKLLVYGLN